MAKWFKVICLVLFVGLCLTSVMATDVSAQDGTTQMVAQNAGMGEGEKTPWKPLASIGAGLAIIGAGLGIGKIGESACASMARQPDMAGKIQTAMIIAAALIEGAAFFALIVCMMN